MLLSVFSLLSTLCHAVLRCPPTPCMCCSDLRTLELGFNPIARLPPALAAATALTRLWISSSLPAGDAASMAVTQRDVDDVLLPMASLRHLSLDPRPPHAVLRRLHHEAPHLKVDGWPATRH